MSKSKTLPAAKFYNEPVQVEELHTGFLRKSPPTSPLTKGFLQQKSWKHRFFVLFKMGDKYQLAYYLNKEKRDKPMGVINLFNISSLSVSPGSHPLWDWIQRHFKCAPSSVLFIKVASRDYFLIGETSDDVDGWFNAINKVLQKLPEQLQNQDETTQATEENRIRSISAPLTCSGPMSDDHSDERWSVPAVLASFDQGHYDYPRKLSEPPELPAYMVHKNLQNEIEDESEEEEEDETDDSNYMCMSSVQTALEEDQKEDSACKQTNTSINGHESPVCNGEANHKDDENKRMSTDEKVSKPLVNGNCASTELDGAPLNESERCTHVEKDICISQKSLKNSLVLTQEKGKPCVSVCREIQDSCLLHKGDQILAFNDLLIDTVEEIHTYLRRLSKDEVKLTIRRPLHLESCPSH